MKRDCPRHLHNGFAGDPQVHVVECLVAVIEFAARERFELQPEPAPPADPSGDVGNDFGSLASLASPSTPQVCFVRCSNSYCHWCLMNEMSGNLFTPLFDMQPGSHTCASLVALMQARGGDVLGPWMIELVGNYVAPLLGSIQATLIFQSATGLLKLTQLASDAAKSGANSGAVRY